MNSLKENMNGIVVCLFELVVGILLTINPIGFTTGIITIAGIVLMLIGLINSVKYFKADVDEAATAQYLTKGLIIMAAGVFCAFKSQWFIVTFPVLTMIYGVVVLLTGIGKVQLTVDMLRRKNKKWFLALISTVLSIACAVVILNNPFSSTAVLWMFTGISLIVESILDIVMLIVGKR